MEVWKTFRSVKMKENGEVLYNMILVELSLCRIIILVLGILVMHELHGCWILVDENFLVLF
jgi:hypothetical protein